MDGEVKPPNPPRPIEHATALEVDEQPHDVELFRPSLLAPKADALAVEVRLQAPPGFVVVLPIPAEQTGIVDVAGEHWPPWQNARRPNSVTQHLSFCERSRDAAGDLGSDEGVDENALTHEERPRPAHGQRADARPKHLGRLNGDDPTECVVVELANAEGAGSYGAVDGEQRAERFPHKLVEAVSEVPAAAHEVWRAGQRHAVSFASHPPTQI